MVSQGRGGARACGVKLGDRRAAVPTMWPAKRRPLMRAIRADVCPVLPLARAHPVLPVALPRPDRGTAGRRVAAMRSYEASLRLLASVGLDGKTGGTMATDAMLELAGLRWRAGQRRVRSEMVAATSSTCIATPAGCGRGAPLRRVSGCESTGAPPRRVDEGGGGRAGEATTRARSRPIGAAAAPGRRCISTGRPRPSPNWRPRGVCDPRM